MTNWLSLSSLREMKTSLLSGYEFDHVSSRQMKLIAAAGKLGLLTRQNASHVGRTTFRTSLDICIFMRFSCYIYLKSLFQSCVLIEPVAGDAGDLLIESSILPLLKHACGEQWPVAMLAIMAVKSIGGSKRGGGGAKETSPLGDQILSVDFMQFLWKINKIMLYRSPSSPGIWRPHLGEILDPPLKKSAGVIP